MTYFWIALSSLCAAGYLDRALHWRRIQQALASSAHGERRIAAELVRVNTLTFFIFASIAVERLLA